jgi:nicotinamide-nucleotide amidase
MESVVLDACRARGLTLAVAESLTGGLIASRLVDVPGASDCFRGGVVAYHPDVKGSVLGVPDGPVISIECAEAMAAGVRDALGADIGIGVTGVAGPDEQEGRAVGTVCMAVDVSGDVTSLEVRLPGRRRQIREFTCISVLNLLRTKLGDGPG